MTKPNPTKTQASTKLLQSPKMALTLSLLILSLSLLPLSLSSLTVYEILPKFGLPSGLLPDTVKSYTLSPNGSFTVELKDTCYVQFEYLVYYEKRVTGLLKYGSITGLKGIQVQRLLFWFDVDEIRVDLPPSEYIYFLVGFINKKLGVDQFKTIHSCRDNKKLKLQVPGDDIEMLFME